jgi:VCBS repeat-containing protein
MEFCAKTLKTLKGSFVAYVWTWAVLALFSCYVPVSNAAELTVCANGCAYTHIQDAIDSASHQDTVRVLAGRYTETITIGDYWEIPINGGQLSVNPNPEQLTHVVYLLGSHADNYSKGVDNRGNESIISGQIFINTLGSGVKVNGFIIDSAIVPPYTDKNDRIGKSAIMIASGPSADIRCNIVKNARRFGIRNGYINGEAPGSTIVNNRIVDAHDAAILNHVGNDNVKILDNDIENSGHLADGIQCLKYDNYESYNTMIQKNSIHGGNIGILNDSGADSHILENIIEKTNSFAILTRARAFIIENTITTCKDGIRTEYPGTGPSDRVEITGNTISFTEFSGINVCGTHTLVSENSLYTCNIKSEFDDSPDYDYASIHVEAQGYTASHSIIINNIVKDGGNGIQVWADYVTVSGNTLENFGQSSSFPLTKTQNDRLYVNSPIIIGSNFGPSEIEFDPIGLTIDQPGDTIFYSADLNQPPSITNLSENTYLVEQDIVLDIQFSLSDTRQNTITFSLVTDSDPIAISSVTSSTPIEKKADNQYQVVLEDNQTQISLTIITQSGKYGTTHISCIANDGSNTFKAKNESELYTISVISKPVISDIPDQTINEGGSFTIIHLDHFISDEDTCYTDITWTFDGFAPLTIETDNRIVTISTPDKDWDDTRTIVFTATDPDGFSVSDSAIFKVIPENDPPIVSQIPSQTVAEGAAFSKITLNDYVNDADHSVSEILWSVHDNNILEIDIANQIASITITNQEWNGTEQIWFTASDPEGLTASVAVQFTVTAVNDAPILSPILDKTINEDTAFDSIELDRFVSDVDNSYTELTWQFSGASELIVTINNRIASISSPYTHWNGEETISFMVIDPEGLSDVTSVTFNVQPVNDAPEIALIPSQTVNEGTPFTNIVLNDYVTDVDNETQFVWTTSNTNNLDVYIIDGKAFILAKDNDWFGVENIQFIVQDSGQLTASQMVQFVVNDVNDPPGIIKNIEDQTIEEGQVFTIIDLVANDIDSDTITWTSTGNTQLQVSIMNDRASISIPNSEWNGSETITFIADDNEGLTVSNSATFTVVGVNDPPILTPISGQTIDEGSAFTNIALTQYLTDIDNDLSEIVWTINGQNNLQVTVADHIAQITITDADWFGTENITFTAADPEGLTASEMVVFEVNSINDLPVLSDIQDQEIAEGETFTSISLDDYIEDKETNDSDILWNYTGTKELSVTINNNRIVSISIPDINWNGTETILFTATDSDGATVSDSVILTVNAVNDPPVISDIPDQKTNEGEPFTAITLDDWIQDIDNPSPDLTWTFIGNNELEISITDRTVTIRIPNENWNGEESITFIATDPEGLSASDSALFTVEPVNDYPVITEIQDQTIDEGAAFFSITLNDVIEDIDNSDEDIVWTYSGVSELDVEIQDQIATIKIPDENWSGSEMITFTATDPGGLSVCASGVFTVNAVNDPPVISDISIPAINEGGTFESLLLDNYVSDIDNVPDEMNWSPIEGTNVSVSIMNRVATISVNNINWFGTETLIFQVSDPGGLTDEKSIEINVLSVNDPPVVSEIDNQVIDEGSTFDIIQLNDLVEDVDHEDNEIEWAIAGATELQVSIVNGDATIIIPNIDWYGSETLCFTAIDPEGLTSVTQAVFIVTSVNDAPVIIKDIPDQRIDEGDVFEDIVLNDYVMDVDHQYTEITWVASGSNSLTVTTYNGIAHIQIPHENWHGSESLLFTAIDPDGLSACDAVQLTVVSVNDAPQVTGIEDQTILEGGSFQSISLVDCVSDLDHSFSEIVWQIEGAQHLQISKENDIVMISAMDENWHGTETIRFIATDPEGVSDSKAAIFKITQVNDQPTVSVTDANISEGDSFTITPNMIWATDVEDDDETLIIAVQQFPHSGQLFVNGNLLNPAYSEFEQSYIRDGKLKYYHDTTNTIEDSFRFIVKDHENLSSIEKVFFITIQTINDAPKLSIHSDITVTEGSAIAITEAVLSATDEESVINNIIFTMKTLPQFGSIIKGNVPLTLQDTFTQQNILNHQVGYVHNGDDTFTTDTFSFTLSDNDPDNEIIIGPFDMNIHIIPQNDPPTILQHTGITLNENESITITTEHLPIHDPDTQSQLLVFHFVRYPDFGSIYRENLLLTETSTFTFADIESGLIQYIHNDNEENSDYFRFYVTDDGDKNTSLDILNIKIINVNDAPNAVDLEQTVSEDSSLTFQLQSNDPDPAPCTCMYQIYDYPTNGSICLSGDMVTYTPNANFNGMDIFTYKAIDNKDAMSEPATVAIQVTPVNDAPELAQITSNITILEDSTLVISNNILSASDVDIHDTLEFKFIQMPSHGQIKMNGVILTDEVTFTLTNIYSNTIQYVNDGEEFSEDAFFVEVQDNTGASDTQMITLTIIGVNDPPVAKSFDDISIDEDHSMTGQLSYSDPEGLTCLYYLDTNPNKGSASIDETTGTYLYTPNLNEYGVDSFTYYVTDPENEKSEKALVTIHIQAINDSPVIEDINDIYLEMNTNSNPIPYNISDAETSLDYLVVDIQPTDPNLISYISNITNHTVVIKPFENMVGTARVIITIRDEEGATAKTDFVVHVDTHDTEPPVLTLMNKNLIILEKGTLFEDPGAIAIDNGIDISDRIQTISTYKDEKGTYLIEYRVTDDAGNEAIPIYRTVIVNEIQKVNVMGNVVSESIALTNVMVSIASNDYTVATFTITNDEGTFEYTGLEITGDMFYLTFSRDGYETITKKFSGFPPYDSSNLLDINMFASESENLIKFIGTCTHYRTKEPFKNVQIDLVSAPGETTRIAETTQSNEKGQYTIVINQKDHPANVILKTVKKGYDTQTEYVEILDSENYTIINSFEISQLTKLNVKMPVSKQEHMMAQENDSVTIIVQAEPPFIKASNEFSIVEPDILSQYNAAEQAYIINYSPYSSFSITMLADTTENLNVDDGYQRTMQIHFTEIPETVTYTATEKKGVTITKGQSVVIKSMDITSRTQLEIPVDDGFDPEKRPDAIDFTLQEYDDYTKVQGKIVSVNIQDDMGNLLGDVHDNPLKKIYISLGYAAPVTREELIEGTFRILHAESAADIFEGLKVPYVPLNQIVEDKTTNDTVTFWVNNLSAFAIQEEIVPETPPSRELPHPPSNCFIQTTWDSVYHMGWYLSLLIVGLSGIILTRFSRKSKRMVSTILGLLFCIAIAFPNLTLAQMQTNKVSFSLMPGGMVFEKNKIIGDGPVIGLGLGYSFTPRLDAEIIAFYGLHNVSYWDDTLQAADYEKSDSYTYNLNMQYHLTPSKIFVPYLNFGIGSMDFESDAIESNNAVRMNYGLGAKYFLDENIALRGDIYHIVSLDDPDNQLLCTLGLTFQLGAEPILKEKSKKAPIGPDKDGDGITDAKDECPDTPARVFVNRVGCPKDSDMDGVYDNLDECPNTPDHAIVDQAGCPKDSDMDGVYDHLDQCPDTPKSMEINAMGCPPDKDKDAVPDYKDTCPDTPANTPVDSNGCPIDNDRDGVLNNQDKCPNTPDNTRVDKNGCPVILDLDNDGIPDSKDQCPDTKPGVPVNRDGCQIVKEQICFPYVVQVSKYQTRKQAHEVAMKYREKGDPLFVSMQMSDAQSMFGIFYGAYPTQAAAEKIVLELKQRRFKNVLLMNLPYAIHVEPNELFIDDATVHNQLIKRGFTSYKIQDNKGVKYYVGAYMNEHVATIIAKRLRTDGFKFTVEKRCIDRYIASIPATISKTKIQDQDNDGVPDISDQCPNTQQHTRVDTHGCAIVDKELAQIPYAVQVSNYPTRKQAHEVAMKYRKRGEPLFVSMIQSSDPKVFSIFYGVYESISEADRIAKNLKMRHFKDVMRLKLPYAILVQPNTVYVDNESVCKHLIEKGFSAYKVSGSDETKYYVGAYANPMLAQKEADILIAEGFDARVEKRTIVRHPEKAKNLPYVLLISAYADQKKAFDVAQHFRKKGDPTYNSYRNVPDTDKNHEIYYGYYQSEQETNEVVETLKKRRFRQIDLKKNPYAICVGIVDQQHDLLKLQAQLSQKGYLSYAIPVFDRPDLFKVYVGAFQSKLEANACLERMKADGFLPTIVLRSDKRSDSLPSNKIPTSTVIDSDQDGIADTLDKCANTPLHTPVMPDGCPKTSVPAKDRDNYPYTIQINAYPDKSKAINVIRKFRKKGDPMYMSYLKMAQSENSYGIFYGYYQSFDAVTKVAAHLKSRLFRRVDILKLPYTIQLGVFSKSEDIHALETKLYKQGYASYRLFQRAGESEIQVLIGAYKTEHGASHFKELLISDGFKSAVIVKRIGAPTVQPEIPLITVLQDKDKDGILDEADQCPGTTPGDIVNQDGCSIAQISEKEFDTEPLFTPLFSSDQQSKTEDYYPYTIRVSSYKDREAANQIAIKFRQKGDSMYTSYGQTKDGTPLHDVFYGFYRNFEESQMAALALEKRHFKNIEMIKMPYAIQVGIFDSYTDLVKKENELMTKGYLTYSVPDLDDSSNIRLLIGAYPTKESAENIVKELVEKGFSPVIVKR